jgi:hypothetical protein
MFFQRSLLLVLFVASVALGRTVVHLDQRTGLLEKRTRVPLFKDPLNRVVNVSLLFIQIQAASWLALPPVF